MYDSNYTNLANAIVLQAVKDYRKAQRILYRYPDHRLAEHESRSIKRFFRSNWFGVLTQIDPDMLISKLKAEVTA